VGGIPIEDLTTKLDKIPGDYTVTLMHGFQDEPTALADNNLARIRSLSSMFPTRKVGFMDHSKGDSEDAFFLPCVALGMGVNCIEKHITLDYLLEIEDYVSALTPERFLKFSESMRNMEQAIGSNSLELSEKEQAYRTRAGKIAIAARDIPAGTIIGLSDIAFKRFSVEPVADAFRTADGLEGKALASAVFANQPLTSTMLIET
jgi:N,N'-diacetyllegionaminate synthase